MICQAIYTSKKSADHRQSDLSDILAASRRNNPDIGITGLLTVTRERYVQVLEGPAETVDMLLEFISQDPRHEGMQVLGRVDVKDRVFGAFAMAEALADDSEASALDARIDDLVDRPAETDIAAMVRDFARYSLASAV